MPARSRTTKRPIEKGDHVFVGNGDVHWVVEGVNYRTSFPVADLVSPMSGVHRLEQVSHLRLHTTAAEVRARRDHPSAGQNAAAERAAVAMLRSEMVAESLVKLSGETLLLEVDKRVFLIEVRAFALDAEPSSHEAKGDTDGI